MEEYIVSSVVTVLGVIFFAIAYLIEKSRSKSLEDEVEALKTVKKAKITFGVCTVIFIIVSILMMLLKICVEWYFVLMGVYGVVDLVSYLIKLITKKISAKLFLIKLILNPFVLIVIPLCIYYGVRNYSLSNTSQMDAKPVIYIYPEVETTVQVSVGYPEKLSCVYPEYDVEEGWEVIAKPNGDLVDTKTGRNLYCLYWEGNQKQEYKFKDGFVVAGKDSAKFLEEKLAILGLNEREANEFIIYWLPKLEVNKYNLIRFETMEEIEEYMPLNIEPKPDSLIRISMNFKGLNRPTEIAEQKLETPVREGYTVVEWGGSEF